MGNPSGTARFGAVITGAGLVAVAGLGFGLGSLIAFGGAAGVLLVGLPVAVRGWSRRLRYQAVIDLPEARAVRRPRRPHEHGDDRPE